MQVWKSIKHDDDKDEVKIGDMIKSCYIQIRGTLNFNL